MTAAELMTKRLRDALAAQTKPFKLVRPAMSEELLYLQRRAEGERGGVARAYAGGEQRRAAE